MSDDNKADDGGGADEIEVTADQWDEIDAAWASMSTGPEVGAEAIDTPQQPPVNPPRVESSPFRKS